MLKYVMFSLLVGTLLNTGPEEVTCKKAPAIFSRRALVREFPVYKTKRPSPTTKQPSPKKDEPPVLRLSIHAAAPSRRHTLDLVPGGENWDKHWKEYDKPRLFEVDKVTAFGVLEKLETENKGIINKLKKLRKPTEDEVKEAEWANKNMQKLSGIREKFRSWDNLDFFSKFFVSVDYSQLMNNSKPIGPWDWLPFIKQEPAVNIEEGAYLSLLYEFPQIFEHEVNQTKLVNRALYDTPKERYEECPKSCPTEAQMVCAKCKEGIYRTFVSVCQLRMFNCKHPEEKVRLVARRPCIMSAPYDKSFENIVAPKKALEDDDPIERHLWCQKHGNMDDPRCKDTDPTVVRLKINPWLTSKYPRLTWPNWPPGLYPLGKKTRKPKY